MYIQYQSLLDITCNILPVSGMSKVLVQLVIGPCVVVLYDTLAHCSTLSMII